MTANFRLPSCGHSPSRLLALRMGRPVKRPSHRRALTCREGSFAARSASARCWVVADLRFRVACEGSIAIDWRRRPSPQRVEALNAKGEQVTSKGRTRWMVPGAVRHGFGQSYRPPPQ